MVGEKASAEWGACFITVDSQSLARDTRSLSRKRLQWPATSVLFLCCLTASSSQIVILRFCCAKILGYEAHPNFSTNLPPEDRFFLKTAHFRCPSVAQKRCMLKLSIGNLTHRSVFPQKMHSGETAAWEMRMRMINYGVLSRLTRWCSTLQMILVFSKLLVTTTTVSGIWLQTSSMRLCDWVNLM